MPTDALAGPPRPGRETELDLIGARSQPRHRALRVGPEPAEYASPAGERAGRLVTRRVTNPVRSPPARSLPTSPQQTTH